MPVVMDLGDQLQAEARHLGASHAALARRLSVDGKARAIISGGEGTAESKIAALKDAGVSVTESPATIGEATAKLLNVEATAAA